MTKMTKREIRTKYGRYAEKATPTYKRKALKILNELSSGRDFSIEIFNDCVTETQVDNRKQKYIMEM